MKEYLLHSDPYGYELVANTTKASSDQLFLDLRDDGGDIVWCGPLLTRDEALLVAIRLMRAVWDNDTAKVEDAIDLLNNKPLPSACRILEGRLKDGV